MPGRARENEHDGRFLSLARLAAMQHAVFDLHQMRTLGLSPRAIQKRTDAGQLHRVYRAVYSLVPQKLLSREGRWMAAVLACGPDAVLSHRTAAALHGLRPTARSDIDVTASGRVRRAHRGIDLHTSITLAPTDIIRLNNIPCTSVARTLLDLADVVERRALEKAFDQAEILQTFDLTALKDQLDRNSNRRGKRTINSILAEYYGPLPTVSELEDAFLAVCRKAGVPTPEVNVYLVLDDGEPPPKVDFLWRKQRLVLETDGNETHRTRQAFERDRRNDQRLTVAGYRPLRATWRQITRNPAQILATVQALL